MMLESRKDKPANSRNHHRRVLLVAPQPFYEDRGTPIAIRHVVTALSQLNWNVDLLTYGVGAALDIPGVRIMRFGTWLGFKSVPIGFSLKKILLDAIMPFAILRRIRLRSYDCIHAVEEAVYPALIFGKLYGIPVIYDMQSSIAEQLSMYRSFRLFGLSKLAHWFERHACDKADVVACSAGLALQVLGNHGPPVMTEWLFPDDVAADASALPPTVVRKHLGISENAKIIIYAGNMASYQGIPMLLAAIPYVLKQYPETVFILVGCSEADIAIITTQHKDLVSQKSLILIQRQARENVRALLTIADLGVSPRMHGSNMPLKVFDFLAAGLPVVATDIAAHQSLVGKGLFLVPPTSRGIADGILYLLQDKNMHEAHRTLAQQVARTRLAWPSFRTQVQGIYDAVLPNSVWNPSRPSKTVLNTSEKQC